MLKILIADDEAPIREWLEYSINKMSSDYKIIGVASNGREALSLYKNYNPDLVITDIKMPYISGTELIEEARKINDSCEFIILTAYSEFDFIRKALRNNVHEYLLKPEISYDLLYEMLSKIDAKINSDTIIEHITEKKFKDVFVNDIEMGKLNINSNQIFCFCFSAPNKLKLVKPLTQMENTYYGNYENHIYIFGNISSRELNSYLRMYAERIFNKNQRKVGISSSFNLKSSLNQSRNILNKAFFNNNESIFIYSETSNCYTIEELNNRCNYILDNVVYNIEELLNELLLDFRRKECLYVSEFKAWLERIISSFLAKLEIQINSEDFLSIFDQINRSVSFFELKFCIDKFFKKIKETKGNYSHLVNKAIKYINENYATIRSIKELSDLLLVNQDYLCKIIKLELGINYSHYLQKVRLDNAAKMIKTSNLKIYEIANNVGYPNVSYFSKIFKETFGLSPHQYRNKR